MEEELRHMLIRQGVDFAYFTDVSALPREQNRKLLRAILIGTIFTEVTKERFDVEEEPTDGLADYTAGYLSSLGFHAFSQSEKNILHHNLYDDKNMQTPLPHKAIARLAGLGWIGKHDLIVNPEFGSAFSMSSVLTDAPLKTGFQSLGDSQCGDCQVCIERCPEDALKGKTWFLGILRDELVDVSTCTSCFACAAVCPWTQRFIQQQQSPRII